MTINSFQLTMSPVVLGQVNPIVINLLVGAFVLVSIVMILIVLIQRPQGGGLGGAFGAGGGGGSGGGGAGQTAFGTKTGDVLTGGTIAIFVLFIIFAVILNFVTRPPEPTNIQPTIAAPDTTELIPIDDEDSETVIDETLQSIEDAANEAGEVVDDAIDGAVDEAADTAAELLETETPEVPANPVGSDD